MVFPWNKRTLSSIGQYKIVKELGRGAFGAVYMAMDQNLGAPVAIKALLLDNPSSLKEEARVLSELRHPNVAGFRQLIEKDRKWYMVIDFVDGGTLRDLIVSRKLDEGATDVVMPRILAIAAGSAAGLGFAHSLGVVHQDVKPSNNMIGANGISKVTDFGLARAHPKSSHLAGPSLDSAMISVRGMTPAYCSIYRASVTAGSGWGRLARWLSFRSIRGKPTEARSHSKKRACSLWRIARKSRKRPRWSGARTQMGNVR